MKLLARHLADFNADQPRPYLHQPPGWAMSAVTWALGMAVLIVYALYW